MTDLQLTLIACLSRLDKVLVALDDDTARKRLTPDSWSALDCIEHLYVVNTGVLRILRAPVTQRMERPPEAVGRSVINRYLPDRTRKYSSPEGVRPTGRFHTLEQARTAMEQLNAKIKAAVEPGEIAFDGQTWQHPYLGEMTKLDWLHFLIAHTDRHLAQIQEIVDMGNGQRLPGAE